MSGLREFENEVRGALLMRRSLPDAGTPLGYPYQTCAARSPDASAVAVVECLLHETDLMQLAVPDSLVVAVGAGNWISWSFQLHPATNDRTSTISKLWNGAGERSFRRCWRPPGRSCWFRSLGAPSLHFEVVSGTFRDGNGTFVQGHVDAANPWSHPVKHFFGDYLPAAGIGRHPDPREMLNSLRHVRT